MQIMEASQFDGKRSVESGTREQQEAVRAILADVRKRKDEALREYTERFDRVRLETFRVSETEFAEANEQVSPQVKAALQEAADNIRDYHSRQVRQSWFVTKESGTMLGQLIRPLQRAGLYVPGAPPPIRPVS